MTFFDKYSYKTKNYALIVLAVLLLAVIWKRSINTTIDLTAVKSDLINKLDIASTADKQIKRAYKEISILNSYIGKENSSVDDVQQAFLQFFNTESNGLQIEQMDEVLNFKHPDFQINTHRIVVSGPYIETTKFIYNFEKEFKMAKLLSVQFESERNKMTNKTTLKTTLLIQNYVR
jgi:hypothetical protein